MKNATRYISADLDEPQATSMEALGQSSQSDAANAERDDALEQSQVSSLKIIVAAFVLLASIITALRADDPMIAELGKSMMIVAGLFFLSDISNQHKKF